MQLFCSKILNKTCLQFLIVVFACLICNSCRKTEFTRQIALTTDSVSISNGSCCATGSIIDLGDGITNFGHCWSTTPNPDIFSVNSECTSFGQPLELLNFSSDISGLEIGKTYYLRSYAQQNQEVIYGTIIQFEYKYYTIKTDTIILINSQTAEAKSSLNVFGTYNIEDYGHCWSAATDTPTISSNITSFGETSKSQKFNSQITNLQLGEKYNIRAYIIENSNVIYSNMYEYQFGSIIFWNTLQNLKDNLNSIIGADIQQQSYIIDDWDEANIEDASFGKGLAINHDIEEGWKNEGGNFFNVDMQNTGFSANQGAIEFWFEFKYNSDANNYAYFFNMADTNTNHFNSEIYHTKAYIEAGWNGWEFFSKKKNFFFSIGNNNKKYTVQTTDHSQIITDSLIFNKGTAMHFAYVWNINGIDNASETMQLYINGIKLATSTDKWTQDLEFDRYFYIGTIPGYNGQDHYYNAVYGIMKDLKIYNYSKTEFNN